MVVLVVVIILFAAFNTVFSYLEDRKALNTTVTIYWMLVLMYWLSREVE